MPYDPTTDRGMVRLHLSDTSDVTPLFTDAEIDAFLSREGSNVKRAAASAMLSMATNEVMVQKRIRILDLQTDGPAQAKELRETARLLRLEAAEDEATAADGAFDFAELGLPPFGDRAKVWNEALRGSG